MVRLEKLNILLVLKLFEKWWSSKKSLTHCGNQAVVMVLRLFETCDNFSVILVTQEYSWPTYCPYGMGLLNRLNFYMYKYLIQYGYQCQWICKSWILMCKLLCITKLVNAIC